MDGADGQVFNLGGGPPTSLLDLAQLLVRVAGRGSHRLVPFPDDRKKIDIGDFYADARKIRDTLGWTSQTPLEEGLARTIAYYRQHQEHYL
jgi:UDP-glucose 4-epimerase